MGVCINYKLSQRRHLVKGTLDLAQKCAEIVKTKAEGAPYGIAFKIRRPDENTLFIDIGNCETLAFEFASVAHWRDQAAPKPQGKGWNYEWAVLTHDGKQKLDEGYKIADYPQNEIWYAAGFCKTQFSKDIVEHKWVADLLKVVASRCLMAIVNDEGDYYHTGDLEDARKSVLQLAAMITGIGLSLKGMGYEVKSGNEV